jgi:cytochrome c biogenesis protein CcdA
MRHLLAVVLLIAAADSANPATIAPALYLAAGKEASRNLLGFIAGVFVVYFVGGLAILLGPGRALLALVPRPGLETRHLLELGLGVGLLVVAVVLWLERKRVARRLSGNQGRADRSSFLVGVGIMAAELPTAFPFFAAIAAILASGKSVAMQIGALALYCVAFVVPLLAILAIRLLARERGIRWLERLRADLDKRLAVVLPALVLVAAIILVALGAIGASSD